MRQVLLAILILVAGCSHHASRADFSARSELHKIVHLAAAESVPPGTSRFYRYKAGHFVSYRGLDDYTNVVEVAKRPDGAAFVVIITFDGHHEGMHGYVYTSRPPTSAELGPDTWGGRHRSFRTFNTREWFVRRRIDRHWWSVYNNLD